jgi:hypothetical protein
MQYRHTQPGTTVMLVSVPAAAVGAGIAWFLGQWPPAIAVIVMMIVVAILFSSLTVEVNERELSWYFGPGLWTYRLPIDAIKDVAIVRNHWWNGWGIRQRPGFRLYNVAGLDAVELTIGPNDIRRIGTDDARGLADVLKTLTKLPR